MSIILWFLIIVFSVIVSCIMLIGIFIGVAEVFLWLDKKLKE